MKGVLDAFGDGPKPQCVGHVDDAAHDGLVLLAARDPPHEGPVDLEVVDREPAQVAQRRVPGTEVVEGELNAQRLQLAQPRDGSVDVGHGGGLGDLQDKPVGGQPRHLESLGHDVDEAGLLQLAGGDVDAHVRTSGQLRRGEAGRAEHPLTDRGDLAARLGVFDEVDRGQQTRARGAPSG